MTKAENGKTFLIKNITKTSNKAKTIQAYLLNSLQNKPLWPYNMFEHYVEKSKHWRKEEQRLLLSYIESHKPISTSTITC